jgi:hypothetical protein
MSSLIHTSLKYETPAAHLILSSCFIPLSKFKTNVAHKKCIVVKNNALNKKLHHRCIFDL